MKLLVLINQSFCGYLIDAKQITNEAKKGIFFSQIMILSKSVFKENRVFIEEEDGSQIYYKCYRRD